MTATCTHSELMIACRHVTNPEPHRRFVYNGDDCVCTECLDEEMAGGDILPNLMTLCRTCFEDVKDRLTLLA